MSAPVNAPSIITSAQLLANDQPPAAGDALHLVSVSGAPHATVALNPQGNVSFTPDTGFSGTTAFTYTVADQQFGLQGTAQVSVTVTPPPAPTAGNGVVFVAENTPSEILFTDVVANASPLNPPLHIASVGQGQNGSASLVSGNVTFSPNTGFVGPASFTYTVANPSGVTSNPGTMTVNVTAVTNPGSATFPITFQTPFGQPLTINADQLAHGQAYSPISSFGAIIISPTITIANPSHGSVTFQPTTGQIVFTPAQGFAGTAGFTWSINAPGNSAAMPIQVQVAPPPPPTAVNDTATATENTSLVLTATQLLANDKASVAGDMLHLSGVSAAQHAVVGLTPQGDVSFSPDHDFTGIATFNYTVADQFGSTATATVAVNVQPLPAPPTPPTPPPAPIIEQQVIQQVAESQVIQQIQQVAISQVQQISIGPTTIVIQAPIQPVPTPTSPALVYFDGTSQAFGSELWSYDGHTVGQAVDINPGPLSSLPADLQAIGSLMYFSADDGVHGRQPWTFDGQHAQMLADINPSGNADPQDFTQLGQAVFFSATDGTDGRQLWQSDATGVHMATDINPGPAGANPANLTPLGDTLYFTASDAQHGNQLWQIAAGGQPSELTTLNPGSTAGAQPDALTPVGNTLFFIANDGSNGRQLFSLSGTGMPVEQVINAGANGAFPAAGSDHALVAVGNSDLYFVANGPGQSATLWHEHLGSPAQQVASLGNLTGPLASVQAAQAGHDLYFAVADSQGNSELARYDTATGQLTTNIAPDLQGAPADLTAVGNSLFFTVLNHTSQGDVQFRDLYADNGQTTQKVALGSQQTLPHNLTASQGQLFFADQGQMDTVNPQGQLAATTLTVPDGHIYVPIDITAAPVPHEVPMLV